MDVDVTVIGAGVVGLAVAAELAGPEHRVLVIERHERIAQETTSRNSEIVHAGINDPPGSSKSELCVQGRRRIEALAAGGRVAYRRIGKLVVANTSEQEAALGAQLERALANGVDDVRLVEGAELAALEPHVRATLALHSPSTGIVSAHGLAEHFLAVAAENGADLAVATRVTGIDPSPSGLRVATEDASGEPHRHLTRVVVNCAGLDADEVAAACGIDVDAAGYRQHWVRGDYFSLEPGKGRLLTHLVYPAPVAGAPGLGIHTTTDLSGRVRLGPDATAVPRDASATAPVDPAKADVFVRVARSFLPWLDGSDLAPELWGIRPKLAAPGGPWRDFVVTHEADRGLPGVVTLAGIESPGLTAAPAIASRVRELVEAAGLI